MDIEKIATSAVTASLSKTERLNSFINEGDKEPCWDGHIYIHENKLHTKKNIKRVSAQVKGKTVTVKKIPAEIKYQISADDLKAYLVDGGTMFFVVYIDKETRGAIQIYFAELLPFKIKQLIATTKTNYKVKFKKFPDDEKSKTELLLNFHSNSKKQTSYASQDLPTIEELAKQNLLESLSFNYISLENDYSEKDLPKIIDGKSLTLYANIKGGVAPIPVEHIENIHSFTMKGERTIPVLVNGIKFYDSIETVTTADALYINIGTSLKLTSPNVSESESQGNIPVKVNAKVKGTLKEQIHNLEFFIDFLSYGCITIGNIDLPIPYSDDMPKEQKILEFEDRLNQLKRVQELLDALNVNKDLDIQNCTKEDYGRINYLISTIIEGETIKECSEKRLSCITKASISNITLALIYVQNDDGSYSLCDFFAKQIPFAYRDEDGEFFETSQFCVLNADSILEYDNVNLQFVIDDFKSKKVSSVLVEMANYFLLQILIAYDKKPTAHLLDAAKQLSDWLKRQNEYISRDITIINELQIIIRERSLTIQEKSDLYKIVENTDDDFFRLGALLLLDEQEEVEKIFNTFNEEQINSFMSFPIYKFYKKK